MRNMFDARPEDGGLFKDFETVSGSIGLRFSRMWIGEMAAIAIGPGHDTPWDLTPIAGISEKLGYKFFDLDEKTGQLVEMKPTLGRKIRVVNHYRLVIHESNAPELEAWIKARK